MFDKILQWLASEKRKETLNLFMELVREKLRFKNGQSNSLNIKKGKKNIILVKICFQKEIVILKLILTLLSCT